MSEDQCLDRDSTDHASDNTRVTREDDGLMPVYVSYT